MKTKIKLKNLYLIGIITIGLVGLGIGSTFAMFTASATINNPIVFNSNLEGNDLLTETVEVTLLPGEEQIVDLVVSNVTSGNTYYSAWYLSDSDYIEEGCSTSNNSYDTTGSLPTSTNFTLTVTLRNRSKDPADVVLGVSNSTVSTIIIPDSAIGITLGELPELINEVAATYITDMYTDSTKTQHTDSKYSITYNYAEDVNLMNDRLGSMSTNIDAGNIRYYGGNPDNYVLFNNELWRIIGVFNNKLKIIRNASIGDYSFDTSGVDVNYGYGINQWGPSTHSTDDSAYDGADLMKLLNPGYNNNTDSICSTTLTDGRCGKNDESLTSGLVNNSLYWNAQSGTCYTGRNYTASNCNFSSSGLKDATSKAMIDEVTWNLGSLPISANPWDGNTTASRLYNWEHSDNSGIQCTKDNAYCSSDVRGTSSWVGKVGLMSPSDYAYATGGGTTHNLNTCLSTHNAYVAADSGILNWSNTYTDCKNNDWLLDKNMWQWTISPRAYSSTSNDVFRVGHAGYVTGDDTSYAGRVRPVVYLTEDTYLWTGEGTSDNPFTLR